MTFFIRSALVDELEASTHSPGAYLSRVLTQQGVASCADLSSEELLLNLLRTKQPRLYAESEVRGDGSDWTTEELRILGQVSYLTGVKIFDNGAHVGPKVHHPAHLGYLLFVPGALLRNDTGNSPADSWVLNSDQSVNRDKLRELYEQRLMPGLLHLCELSKQDLLLTLPGIGCGQFAGAHRGSMGEHLKLVLLELIEKYAPRLPSLKAVYYDPFKECRNEDYSPGGIDFQVRPLAQNGYRCPQLCRPEEFDPAFAGYRLVSVVAWDHVSWPGNDFYVGNRATDDGVKAAATDVIRTITGQGGAYDETSNCYLPPAPFDCWEDLVNGLKLELPLQVVGVDL